MSCTTTLVRPGSIGADLERRRLQHRARRIELALAALQRLSGGRARDGRIPPSLGLAISDFAAELAQTQRRLAEL